MKPLIFGTSGGHWKFTPSHTSAASQPWPTLAARHSTPASFGASAGQLPAPSQFSGSSHNWPALAARHSVVAGSWFDSQVPDEHVSGSVQSVSLPSPHAGAVGLEDVGRTIRSHAVALLLDVAVAGIRTADRADRLHAVGRAGRVDPVAFLGLVAFLTGAGGTAFRAQVAGGMLAEPTAVALVHGADLTVGRARVLAGSSLARQLFAPSQVSGLVQSVLLATRRTAWSPPRTRPPGRGRSCPDADAETELGNVAVTRVGATRRSYSGSKASVGQSKFDAVAVFLDVADPRGQYGRACHSASRRRVGNCPNRRSTRFHCTRARRSPHDKPWWAARGCPGSSPPRRRCRGRCSPCRSDPRTGIRSPRCSPRSCAAVAGIRVVAVGVTRAAAGEAVRLESIRGTSAPEQVSCTSHSPVSARQSVPSGVAAVADSPLPRRKSRSNPYRYRAPSHGSPLWVVQAPLLHVCRRRYRTRRRYTRGVRVRRDSCRSPRCSSPSSSRRRPVPNTGRRCEWSHEPPLQVSVPLQNRPSVQAEPSGSAKRQLSDASLQLSEQLPSPSVPNTGCRC